MANGLLSVVRGGDEEGTILFARGELDAVTSDVLVSEGRLALASAGAVAIAIDMSGVTFMGAAGVAALAALADHARSLDADLRVVCPSPIVRRVIGILRFDELVVDDGMDVAAAEPGCGPGSPGTGRGSGTGG